MGHHISAIIGNRRTPDGLIARLGASGPAELDVDPVIVPQDERLCPHVRQACTAMSRRSQAILLSSRAEIGLSLPAITGGCTVHPDDVCQGAWSRRMSIKRWIAPILAIALFPIGSVPASAQSGNAFKRDYWLALPRDPGSQTNIDVSDEAGFYQVPIGVTAKATVSQAMTGSIDGITWNVAAGEVLLRHFSVDAANEISAYCTEERKIDRNIKSSFGKSFKLCFLDSDQNHVFESYILDGSKNRSQGIADGGLSPFTVVENAPLCEKCYIELIYYNGGAGRPNVAYQVVVEGKEVSTPGMVIQGFDNPRMILKLDNWQFVQRKDPLPQSFDFGFAKVTVRSFDQKARVANLDVAQPSSPRIFSTRSWPARFTIYY
ncbi:hypothetical protein [Sphingomonas colocasiae]|uniref:DUF3108 domain-containing protein n=1 Tax=Sphingomonas colocasiae TaxID=1848973 RepID=A0ABS7PUU0_9SPHN|nr:hypothetical protein [Sphingomonas colocasiae]MBY8825043.1 hypothetical protein [Sphingomonas colocasiae]